jgi:hypothetical protein
VAVNLPVAFVAGLRDSEKWMPNDQIVLDPLTHWESIPGEGFRDGPKSE